MLSTASQAYTTHERACHALGGAHIKTRVRVRLTPRVSREAIVGWRDDVLRVHVTAPPGDGRANEALERLLAKALGLPRKAVCIVSGVRGREKSVAIAGVSREQVIARLGRLA